MRPGLLCCCFELGLTALGWLHALTQVGVAFSFVAGLEVERAIGQEPLGGRPPAQGVARFGVVVRGDGIELILGADAQI